MGNIIRMIDFKDVGKTITAVGIDLGTTNSTVSIARLKAEGGISVGVLEIPQPTETGDYISSIVPSVVAQLSDDTIWVGEGAKRLRAMPQKANLVFEKTSSTIQKTKWA